MSHIWLSDSIVDAYHLQFSLTKPWYNIIWITQGKSFNIIWIPQGELFRTIWIFQGLLFCIIRSSSASFRSLKEYCLLLLGFLRESHPMKFRSHFCICISHNEISKLLTKLVLLCLFWHREFYKIRNTLILFCYSALLPPTSIECLSSKNTLHILQKEHQSFLEK